MVYGLAGIASLLGALYFWWSFSGPFRWIAQLQSALWGVNIINLSLVITWAALYLPLHFAVRALERRAGVKRDPITWTRFVALLEYASEQRPGQLAAMGLIIFGVGGWLWGRDVTSGPLTDFTVARAQHNERPASRYVRLRDAKILRANELTFKRNSSIERYYPVISSTAPEPSRISVFVRLDGADAASPPTEILGELEFDGLPGGLRAQLDERLVDPNYFVVRHNWSPIENAGFAAKLAGLGAVMFAAGLLWARSRARRSSP